MLPLIGYFFSIFIPIVTVMALITEAVLIRLQLYNLVERKVQGDGNCQVSCQALLLVCFLSVPS